MDATNDLTTFAVAKLYIGASDTDKTYVARFITTASLWLNEYTNKNLKARNYDGVTSATAAIAERSTGVITLAVKATYEGKWFVLYDGTTPTFVWFDITGSDSKPVGEGYDDAADVDIDVSGIGGTDVDDVGAILHNHAGLAIAGFTASYNSSTDTVTFTADNAGVSTDIDVGNTLTATAVFSSFAVTTQGVNGISIDGPYDGDGGLALFLTQTPVNSITTVHQDSSRTFGTDTLVASTDYVSYANGKLFADGIRWYTGAKTIKIAYNAGYSTIPAPLEQACLIIVDYLYKAFDKHRFGLGGTSEGEFVISYIHNMPKEAKELALVYRRTGLA